MCTVTYIPQKKGFCLTFSRDEKASRTSLSPEKYNIHGIEVFCPKDEQAGGTWIATDYHGHMVCLLNGAFVNHVRSKKYSKSRGIILLERFKYTKFSEFVKNIVLDGVEPFTMIGIDYVLPAAIEFMEFRWDGENKHFKYVDTKEVQMWSSATLYNSDTQQIRLKIFKRWVEKFKNVEDCNILNFHCSKHGLKPCEEILMKGTNDLRTLSITQITSNDKKTTLSYCDVLNQKIYVSTRLKTSLKNA